VSELLAAVAPLALCLRWLASGAVTVTADPFPVVVPVLLVVAVVVVSAAAAVVALVMYRTHIEPERLAAWQARKTREGC